MQNYIVYKMDLVLDLFKCMVIRRKIYMLNIQVNKLYRIKGDDISKKGEVTKNTANI